MLFWEMSAKKWNLSSCYEEALKYEYLRDFRKFSGGCYVFCHKHGILQTVSAHFKRPKPYQLKYSLEFCTDIALKYSHRYVFSVESPGAYGACSRNGWLDAVCKHMSPLGSRYYRKMYLLSFKDGSKYVGYSYNPSIRISSHLNNSSNPNIRGKISNEEIVCIKTTSNFLPVEVADRVERKYIKLISHLNPSKKLNVSGGGQRGGPESSRDFKRCLEEAKKYSTRASFSKNSPSFYSRCSSKGWLKEVCDHMDRKPIKCKNYWNEETVKQAIMVCTTLKYFREKYASAYDFCLRNTLRHLYFSLEHRETKPLGFWNDKDLCIIEASNYSNRREFQKKCSGAFKSMVRNRWSMKEHFTQRQK